MKKLIIISIIVVLALFFLMNKKTANEKHIADTYPWQIKLLANGRSSVFGMVLGETSLQKVDMILKIPPKMALFEANNKMSLEAYYKNISLGGLIGSFIFTLNIDDKQLEQIKKGSHKQERAENNGRRYELDKPTSDSLKQLTIKNLIYIPTVQLDEETIVNRFGKPKYKIKLKTKELGWHYLYPEKGLDLIFKQEGKEVLQYIQPKNFNALLEPLQSLQNQKH